MQRVLVCGGRNFNDREFLFATLDHLHNQEEIFLIIHGGARGADDLAGEWAFQRKVTVQVFPAEWDKWGLGAGHVRNAAMLRIGKPTMVVAFPGGKGTANMVKQAKEADIRVLEVNGFASSGD